MINEMVYFASILRRISKELYHDSKGLTLVQKSTIAMELDVLFDGWKAQLPEWLNFGKVSFREEEWAAKQKLVLNLRYLNAKILLHRPFLVVAMSKEQLQTTNHGEQCLNAAQETIRILYDAYANRHYFRTWWYNSTYTLYAGMIVLYVIILGHSAICSKELLKDVIKAQDILHSMEEATVARRSAGLMREGIEVALACIRQRQNPPGRPQESRGNRVDDEYQGQVGMDGMPLNAENDFSPPIWSHTTAGQDPIPLLASWIDSNMLQDFTTGISSMSEMDFSTYFSNGSYSDGLNDDLTYLLQ